MLVDVLMPWPHHPDNTIPTKIRMFFIGLHDPVKIAHSIFDNVREIDSDQDIDGQTLTRFLDKRNLQLPENLAPSTVATEEILGSDSISLVREVVFDFAADCT